MTTEQRLNSLEARLNNLQNAFLQAQKNQVPITAKTDNNAVKIDSTDKKVDEITPYKASQTAYIDDIYVTFADVPSGNYTVYMTDTDGQNVPFTSERVNDTIKVMFEKRTSLATVTISIL